MTNATILFLGTLEDKEYLPRLKGLVGAATTFVITQPVSTLIEVILYCKKRNITGVISTNTYILKRLLGREHEVKTPTLDNYAGSFIKRDGIDFVFIHPLEQLVSIPYMPFLVRRFISKLTEPQEWKEPTVFNWNLITPENVEGIYELYKSAFAIAVDIETLKDPLSIRCISYTAIFLNGGDITTHTCVIPLDSLWALAWVRKFNWELQAPKIFQNGKYDNAYLCRFNAIIYNWLWDTAHLFHCHYSELPKDLAFLNAFFIRTAMYWKDLAETNDLMEYYRYNALDTWATANVWMVQLLSMPAYAQKNYVIEFPLVFPCHLSEMTGMQRDTEILEVARTQITDMIASKSSSLDTMLAVKNFNVNSPPQIKQMLHVLGCKDLPSGDEKNLRKAMFRHPLNNRIIHQIVGVAGSREAPDMGIRGLRKLKSTYLRTDADITKTSKGGSKDFNGRILYAINPHGTDTSRLASSEHHFWCGFNIQNQPRGREVKQTIVADDGFLFAECDLEQAESRDTAFISGEESLISAVTGTRDFHSVNTSKFFGVPYESVYDDGAKKVINKILRDLAKRTNHGANYNMGPEVMVDTMGLEKIYQAAALLKLPKTWTPKQIAEYLLECFHTTYPGLKGTYYPGVVKDVLTTNMLVGATGWTRYCFGDPTKNKRILNSYVAHPPQSLNAQVLNKAYLKVFYDVAIHPEHWRNFKLCTQIHDSILFQFRIGHGYLMDMVKDAMEIPVTVRGYDGKIRTFTVPAALKAGKDKLGVKYWSDVE